MPAYQLDLWIPSCMTTWKYGKFLGDGFRECWPMKSRLHASHCVRQCYHVTRVWIVLSFHQLSQWMRHGCRCSILKPNGNRLSGSTLNSPPPKKLRVTASAEKMMIPMFWDSEGVTLIAFPRVQQWRVRLMKMCYEVSSSIAGKTAQKAAAVFLHHDNAPPHSAPRVHQFFDNFEVVPHAPYSPDLAPSDFWLFPTPKGTSWSHIFKSFRSCNSDFPVVTTNPYRSVCCGHAIVASALWKMYTSTGWLVEKLLHFQLPRMSNFLNKFWKP